MKRVVVFIFTGVLLLTLGLVGYYIYASGRLVNTINFISGNKIAVTSQTPNLKVAISDQQKLESLLNSYDILGDNKNIALKDNKTVVGNVKSISVVFVKENAGYRETYNKDNPSQLAYSYYPEYDNGQLQLFFYVNPEWIKSLGDGDKKTYITSAILSAAYLSTHKITTLNVNEIKEKWQGIYAGISQEKPEVFKITTD